MNVKNNWKWNLQMRKTKTMYGISIKIDSTLFIKYHVPLLSFVVCTSTWHVVFSKHLTEDVSGNVGSCIFCTMKNYKNIIFFYFDQTRIKKSSVIALTYEMIRSGQSCNRWCKVYFEAYFITLFSAKIKSSIRY